MARVSQLGWLHRWLERSKERRAALVQGRTCEICCGPKLPGQPLCDECEIVQQTAP